MVTKEHISLEANSSDSWICVCGNTSFSDGFFPCDKNGDEIVPSID